MGNFCKGLEQAHGGFVTIRAVPFSLEYLKQPQTCMCICLNFVIWRATHFCLLSLCRDTVPE